MDPILYNSVMGGRANFNRQEVIAHNLANTNTPGFRADLYQAKTMYASGDGHRFQPSFTVQVENSIDFTPGELIPTGRDLDVAVDGNNGWFVIQDKNGQEAYTRSGSLRLNSNGRLTTGNGNAVMGYGGPITLPPAKSIDIGPDGTISIVPLGGDSNSAVTVDRIKMVKLDHTAINKNPEGLFQLKNGGKAPADNTIKLRGGVLEGSNVNAVEQMVAMITSGRDFEARMNVLSTVSENAQKLAQLVRD